VIYPASCRRLSPGGQCLSCCGGHVHV